MTDLITKDSSQIHLGHSSFGSSLRTVAYSGLALLNLTAFLIQGCSKSLDPAPPKVTNYSVPVNVWLSANNPAWESNDPKLFINPEGGGTFEVNVQLEFSGKGDISPPIYLFLKSCLPDGTNPYYTDVVSGSADCPVFVSDTGVSTVYAGSASAGYLDPNSLIGHMLRVQLASITPEASRKSSDISAEKRIENVSDLRLARKTAASSGCYDEAQVESTDSVRVVKVDVKVTTPR